MENESETTASAHVTGKHIIYLACPYTNHDTSIRMHRFDAANKAAAKLIKAGHTVYSPISMTHPIDIELAGNSNTLGSDFWVSFDEAFMEVCSEIVVLQIEGWDSSSGVSREIEYFKKKGKPVSFIEPHAII